MPRPLALLLCIALAGALAWAASRSPAPAPVSAPPGQFSSDRAMADVRAVGSTAHPIGSAEHDRVLAYLVSRFRSLGLQVRVQDGQAFERSQYDGEASIEGGVVHNIVAVLPGQSRTEPAVAIVAHYDSVPGSPGAADDTVGVAAALEIARALRPVPLRRDLIFLITDGEEAGLLGARSFFADDPLARRIGAVLNMESRGGGGRAFMFETGADDGAMIDLFRRTAVNPTSNSLAGYIYAHMPNDTDFTVAKRAGVAGFNYAFIGRPFDYHAASSTPATLDQGSLQHIGEQVLSAARALTAAPSLPARRPDVVYGDILGGPMLVYPVWGGWIVLLASGLIGVLAFRRVFKSAPFHWTDAARGAAALLLTLVFSGLVLAVVRIGVGVPQGFMEQRPLLAQFGIYEAALALAALGAAILALTAARLGGGRFWGAWAGALALTWVLGVALQLAAPLVGFVATWPLLAACANAAMLSFACAGRRKSVPSLAATVVLGGLILAELIYFAHAVALGVGADIPEALSVFVMIAALTLFPLLWPGSGELWTLALGGAALAACLGLTLFIRLHDPASPRYPRPTDALYVADPAAGRFYRASPMAQLDGWTAGVLDADGGSIQREPLEPMFGSGHWAKARPIVAAAPQVSIEKAHDGWVVIHLASRGPARQLRLDLRTAQHPRTARINGLDVQLSSRPGAWTRVVWNAPAHEGLTLTLEGAGAIETRWAAVSDGWPADAAPLPPRPANAMPWQNSDSTAVIGATKG